MYLAVNSKIRSKGYGGKLLATCNNYLEQNFDINTILIEVDSVNEQTATDMEIRVKRQEFYKRHGARKIGGFNYQLPLVGADYYPVMELQFISHQSFTELSKSDLEIWLKAMYKGIYREAPDHPYITSMLKNAPEVLRVQN